MKICSVCHQEKSHEEFHKHGGYKDGRNIKCISCEKDRLRNGKIRTKQAEKLGILYEGVPCECCGKTTSRVGSTSRMIRPVVDHCHETGKIRGILCYPCNMGIGHLGDTLNNLRNAIRYLERNKDE